VARRAHDLPTDVGAEVQVINRLLLDPQAIADGLVAGDFSDERNAIIFGAIGRIRDRGHESDFATVRADLEDDGLLQRAGGDEHLTELHNEISSPGAHRQHLDRLRQVGRQRRLVFLADDLSRASMRGESDIIDSTITTISALATGATTPSTLPTPIDWHELFQRNRDERDWLIEDLWPAGRLISLTARTKVGKSLLMLYLAVCLAIGRDPWTGRRVPPLDVIYLDMEMTEDDLVDRLDDMGITADQLCDSDGRSRLHYFQLPLIPRLDTPAGGSVLAELAELYNAGAVIIDTFARVIEARPDFTGVEIKEFWRWSGQPLRARGIGIARLDHVGHQERTRAIGSATKGADVDVGWILERGEADTYTLKHYGMSRLSWVPASVALTMRCDPLDFRRAQVGYAAGTKECADALDELGVPLDASANQAQRILKAAGRGVSRRVVLDAVRYRHDEPQRTLFREPSEDPEPPPEPPFPEPPGGSQPENDF
jgi:hypothetical protein